MSEEFFKDGDGSSLVYLVAIPHLKSQKFIAIADANLLLERGSSLVYRLKGAGWSPGWYAGEKPLEKARLINRQPFQPDKPVCDCVVRLEVTTTSSSGETKVTRTQFMDNCMECGKDLTNANRTGMASDGIV